MSAGLRFARRRAKLAAELAHRSEVGAIADDKRLVWRVNLLDGASGKTLEVRSQGYGVRRLFRGTLGAEGPGLLEATVKALSEPRALATRVLPEPN
ncbi:unnamed protein product, partial [Polarella glacialis]